MKSIKQGGSLHISNQVSPERLQLPRIQLFHQKENPIISIPFSKHGKQSLFPSFHPDKVLQQTLNERSKVNLQLKNKRSNRTKEEKSIYETKKMIYTTKEDQGTEPLFQTSFTKNNLTRQSIQVQNNSMIIPSVNSQSIDNFLHRNQMSIDVAEQMKRLNNEIQSSSLLLANKSNISDGIGINLSSMQSNSIIQYKNDNISNSQLNRNPYKINKFSSTPTLHKRGNQINNLRINPSSQSSNQNLKGLHSQTHILEIEDRGSNHILPTETKQQGVNSSNFFGLTHSNDDLKLSEHQMNLLHALNMCNPSKLDSLVKENQHKAKEHKEQALQIKKHEYASRLASTFNLFMDDEDKSYQQSGKKHNNIVKQVQKQQSSSSQKPSSNRAARSDTEISTPQQNYSQFKNSNLHHKLREYGLDSHLNKKFQLQDLTDDIEEQIQFTKEQQNQMNYKMFYSHFDDTFQDIMELIKGNNNYSTNGKSHQKNIDNQNKPRFNKVTPIRPEILFNLKQMIRMQRIREEKIYKEEIKPDEMIEYMKKRNQIEIILENSKKIKNLRVVADLIEKEIEVQNEKINTLVQVLIKKFGLQSYQQEEELLRAQAIN